MRTLKNYRLLRLLGEGGEGRAYLALDLQLMRRVVIKLYNRGSTRAEHRHFAAEARRLADLEGPRVVQVLDVVVSGEHAAVALRYIPGCNLEELLQRESRLAPEHVLSILTDLAAGLAAARQQVLVHGDMKCSNILLGMDGHAAISDFGIATSSGHASRGTSKSSLTPEHLNEQPLSQQSDFFALGLLAYRMLAGHHPFMTGGHLDEGRLRTAEFRAVKFGDSVSLDAAERYQALLQWLLAPRPEARPPSTQKLRNELREIRGLLKAPRGIAAPVLRHARSEVPDMAIPPVPERLLNPPALERWGVAARELWNSATIGARLTLCGTVALLLWIGALYTQQPGPCVIVMPVEQDVSPLAAVRLPTSLKMEERVVYNLRNFVEPMLVLGENPSSDSRRIMRSHGLRDRCVAERQVWLAVHCWDGDCRIELRADGPGLRRRSSLPITVDIGLPRLQETIDQLLAPHMEAIARQ